MYKSTIYVFEPKNEAMSEEGVFLLHELINTKGLMKVYIANSNLRSYLYWK